MMNVLGNAVAWLFAHWWVISAAILFLIALRAVGRSWEHVRFWAMRVWYGLPVIGKAKRLSHNHAPSEDGWFMSELTLCRDFNSHLVRMVADTKMYARSKRYLAKVQEIGRSPLSLAGWALLFLLVFIESLGFTYVLAGYTLPGSSEALQIPAALAISLLVAIVLVFLTHAAGQEAHKRALIKKAREMWQQDETGRENLIGHEDARLEMDEEDDRGKSYIKLIRRLETNENATPGMPWRNILAAGVILLIAAGAFYVRYQTYESGQICDVIGGQKPSNIFSGIGDLLQGNRSSLPSVITEPQHEAEQRGQTQQCAAEENANVTTYVILAILFIVVQIIGWTLGNRTGFAGKESYRAWLRVRNFDSQKEYENWVDMKREWIIGITEKYLANLKQLLSKSVIRTSSSAEEIKRARENRSKHTFRNFLANNEKLDKPSEPRDQPSFTAPQTRPVTETS